MAKRTESDHAKITAVTEIGVETGSDEALLVQAANRNKPEKMSWLQDQGFGMFIHWSVDVQLGCVIGHSMVGASREYLHRFVTELPKTFNPKAFDAEEIAVLAKTAGVKYVVLTTKHHNGFCLWNTRTTDFNVMNTPYGKDIVGQYVAALRKHGLKVGLYYSIDDFLLQYREGLEVTRGAPASYPASFQKKWDELVRQQCTELMTGYGPIDVLFFDGYADVAKRTCWDLQPDVLVTAGALRGTEQHLPGIGYKDAWEACITLGTAWQYQPTNESYKSGGKAIEMLIETRAKGGSLLLNIGPDSHGRVPLEQENILREIGLWNFINDEAIFDTRSWTITNEDNIWFTKARDEDTVYAIITKVPDWRGQRREFLLKSVNVTDKTQISVLGQSSGHIEYQPQLDVSCRFEQCENGVKISVVRAQRIYCGKVWPNPLVVKLTHVKPAIAPPEVVVLKDQTVLDRTSRTAALAGEVLSLGSLSGVEAGFTYRVYPGFAMAAQDSNWTDSELVHLESPGRFSIQLKDLPPGVVYEYKAFVRHPRVTMCSEAARLQL